MTIFADCVASASWVIASFAEPTMLSTVAIGWISGRSLLWIAALLITLSAASLVARQESSSINGKEFSVKKYDRGIPRPRRSANDSSAIDLRQAKFARAGFDRSPGLLDRLHSKNLTAILSDAAEQARNFSEIDHHFHEMNRRASKTEVQLDHDELERDHIGVQREELQRFYEQVQQLSEIDRETFAIRLKKAVTAEQADLIKSNSKLLRELIKNTSLRHALDRVQRGEEFYLPENVIQMFLSDDFEDLLDALSTKKDTFSYE